MAMKMCQEKKRGKVVTKKGWRIAKGGRCVPAKHKVGSKKHARTSARRRRR